MLSGAGSAAPQQRQQLWERTGAKQVAFGLAASLMMHTSAASAGVIFEERTLKKVCPGAGCCMHVVS